MGAFKGTHLLLHEEGVLPEHVFGEDQQMLSDVVVVVERLVSE